MNTLVLHHNDQDGFCSAAIVNKYYKENEWKNIKFMEVDYLSIPKLKEIDLSNIHMVYILDFWPGIDYIKYLREKSIRTIWIDHHKTAIEEYNEFLCSKEGILLEGNRQIGLAACELIWNYCFGGNNPQIVQIIADYDVWRRNMVKEENWNKYVLPVLEYVMVELSNPQNEEWFDLLENSSINVYDKLEQSDKDRKLSFIFQDILNKGNLLMRAKQRMREIYQNNLFECSFAGYKTLAVNAPPNIGFYVFESIPKEILDKYDLFLRFAKNGIYWKYTIYSRKDNIDCATICSQWPHGGGHFHAAGAEVQSYLIEDEKEFGRN